MMKKLQRAFLFAIIALLSVLWFAGCEIEESARGLTGSLVVSLHDTTDAEIFGAEILVDGVAQTQRTPATLREISVGEHSITAHHPSYEQVTGTAAVALNQTASLTLTTRLAPVGTIEFAGVPDGTVLLVNTIPLATTPPNYLRLGTGTHLLSCYLPDHTTQLPSRWEPLLTIGDTVTITPHFAAKGTGGRVDSLAPVFFLADDYDSTVISNSSFRGFVTVVTFFYYNCAPCLEEFPSIQATYVNTDFAGKVQFFALDDADAWTIFRTYREDHATLGLTFPLLWDPGAQMSARYGVTVHPVNFVIDQSGRIRYRFAQVNQSILRNAIEFLLAEGE
jgi:peroxiredoxin